MKTRMRLRHFGSPGYNPALFKTIADALGWQAKPRGGLWTSPVNSDFGWADWCKSEDFRTHALKDYFDLDFQGELLVIDSEADLEKIPWVDLGELTYFPIFMPLVLCGIDGLHLTWKGQRETRFSRPKNLYGWDCETVLVFNPDSIKPVMKHKILRELRNRQA
jgi:hypothetical protein